MSNRLESTTVDGVLRCTTFYPPNQCIPDEAIQDGANIQASKLEHTHRKSYSQTGNAAADAGRVIHVVNGATARNLYVRAGSITAAVGAAVATIDIKKNGTSVMTAATPITLNSSNVAYTPVELSIATTTAVVGDVFTVVVTATAGGGTLATGLFVEFEIDEVATV